MGALSSQGASANDDALINAQLARRSTMRYIKLICLTLIAVGVLATATEGVASAVPQYIYKVNGKKLEAGEEREISVKLKAGTKFTIKAKGALGVEAVIKCDAFKLAPANPMILGGIPAKSKNEFFAFEECSATVGGEACTVVVAKATELKDELVSILKPAGKAGKLANWFVPVNAEKIFAIFELGDCGIFGNSVATGTGTTAALITPEAAEGVALTWVWKTGAEEITEIERKNGEKLTVGLTTNGKKATLEGEVEVELVTGENWGAF